MPFPARFANQNSGISPFTRSFFVIIGSAAETNKGADTPPGVQESHNFAVLFRGQVGPVFPSRRETNRIETTNNRRHDSHALLVGGRLSHFLLQWLSTTQDEWALEIVSEGYCIEFRDTPWPRFLSSPLSTRPQKQRIMLQAVQHLRQIEAVEKVSKSEQRLGVYSIFFTVPKCNSDHRSVLDLKYVNQSIRLRHFQMEPLKSLMEALQPGEFLTSLDLIEAYLHVPIHRSHRKFLHFCVGRDHLQFKALPFGLSTAPRVFTKLLVNPVSFLRQQGIHVHPYLDDLLIRSRGQAVEDT